jgi:type II secretory pathway predicted ATPase ExeA
VLYLCDTAVSPNDLYRTIALDLGVAPSHRRGHLWADIKKALVHLVDERNTKPVFVIDEAQHLSDAYLRDLAGFLNFTFDSRNLITFWLVGLTPLVRRLHMRQHDALRTRIEAVVHLEPLDRESFAAAVDHGFKAAGTTTKVVADEAMEMLFRSSQGVLRTASKTLRAALRIANEKGQAFIDDRIVQEAIDEMGVAL